jgi:WD40 repeat protein
MYIAREALGEVAMVVRCCRAGLLVLPLVAACAHGQDTTGLYDRPVPVVDTGMHTAIINRAAVDAKGVYAVTGSDDRTVRIWSVSDGKLLRTIRMPVGPGDIGKVYAVAISPDGNLVAAGGWTRATEADPQEQIYLFDLQTGAMVRRLEGLPNVVLHLTFSPNGRHLAATLGGGQGLRIYDREEDWRKVLDTVYGDDSYGADFAADGRLATTSYDGFLRLYHYDAGYRLEASMQGPGDEPFDIAFSPDGKRLAVGYNDAPRVAVLDGATLELLSQPDITGIDNGDLLTVAWSADGKTLFAGGAYQHRDGLNPVVAWSAPERREFPASRYAIGSLAALTGGDLLVASADPYLGLFAADGFERWAMRPPQADFRGQRSTLAVAADGSVIDFGYEQGGGAPARFDLNTLGLHLDPSDDGVTAGPEQETLPVENWISHDAPTLDGEPLPLDAHEISYSLAIHPDGARFVLGTDWWLRAFDAAGELLWRREAPAIIWAVNITGDGRLVVAAYGDGTIRWHRMDDGRELLAFFPLADRKNWVAWTPEGFYGATPGAYSVLRWHVNDGWDQAAESIPVTEIPLLRRPRLLPIVLQENGDRPRSGS